MDKRQLMQQIITDNGNKQKGKKRSGAANGVIVAIGLAVVGAIGFTGYVFMQNLASESNDKLLKQQAIESSPKSPLRGQTQAKSDGGSTSGGMASDSNPENLLSYGMPRTKVELLIGDPQGACETIAEGDDMAERCLYEGTVKSVTYKDDKLDSAEFKNGSTLTKNGVKHL